MQKLYRAAAILTIAGAMAYPFYASALGLSFGGRITTINYCINGAIVITIIPAGLFPITYMWTPGTLGFPPIHPGQEILGVSDIPYVCVGPGTHPLQYTGRRIQFDGVSI